MGLDTLAILDASLSVSEIVDAIANCENAANITWRCPGGSTRYILVDLLWQRQPISLNIFLEGYCCEDYAEIHQKPITDGHGPLTLLSQEWQGSPSGLLQDLTKRFGGWFLSHDSTGKWEAIPKG